MKVTEKHMITTNEFEVQRWNIDTFMKSIKIMGIPKIHKNDDGKIYAIDLLNHDGSTKTRFIFENMTDEENEELEELLK
jgi:hypothetical protein